MEKFIPQCCLQTASNTVDWGESVTTLPDDWFCPLGPKEQGGLFSNPEFKDIHSECPTYLGDFITTVEGIVKCPACQKEVGIETDLEADMLVEDGGGEDDDDDGNMDNPEFNNVDAVLEQELKDETPEEQMFREVRDVVFKLADELLEYAKKRDDTDDAEEQEHFEQLGNKATFYSALLTSEADAIAGLYLFFSKHGINAFGGERVAFRRSAVLAVFLVYRMDRGFVFDEIEMVKLLAENLKRVNDTKRLLIRARLGEEQNMTGYYIPAYAKALGLEAESADAILNEWNRDIEPFIILDAKIVALAFILAAAEAFYSIKIATSTSAERAGLNRDSVGRARKKFAEHFKSVKATTQVG